MGAGMVEIRIFELCVTMAGIAFGAALLVYGGLALRVHQTRRLLEQHIREQHDAKCQAIRPGGRCATIEHGSED